MKTEHFTKANLAILGSCFLDAKGNFISGGVDHEIGVHEEQAQKIVKELCGNDEDKYWTKQEEISEKFGFTYEFLESIGYLRYSHWVGLHGVFNGELDKMTLQQKAAIRQFCRVKGTTWDKVVKD